MTGKGRRLGDLTFDFWRKRLEDEFALDRSFVGFAIDHIHTQLGSLDADEINAGILVVFAHQTIETYGGAVGSVILGLAGELFRFADVEPRCPICGSVSFKKTDRGAACRNCNWHASMHRNPPHTDTESAE